MGDFIQKGGFMMSPLPLCSVVLVALIAERAITRWKATTDAEGLLEEIQAAYTPSGDPARIDVPSRIGLPASSVRWARATASSVSATPRAPAPMRAT